MTLPLGPSALPITEDDAFIAAALEDASIPTLMVAMTHVSGDPSWLRGPIRPKPPLPGEQQGFLTEEEKAEVRARALEALAAYREGGCRLPPPPSAELVREMLSFIAGEPLPDEYVPMMLEELALRGDAREIDWSELPAEARRNFRVLVVGAGMSGLLTAIRLEEAGISYLVVEKNEALGGTWHENTYPGCRVDVQNHFYAYSFEPNHDWDEYYSQQRDLQAYFEHCATKYNVRDNIRFDTEVISARWSEELGRWEVCVRAKEAEEETLAFNAIVSAVGQLNRPKQPAFPGLEDFEGVQMHSAEWRSDVSLEGRRVAVVGTGASALQLVPEVAKEAAHLVVFQRSPPWMAPNPRYHARVSDEKKWLLKHVPFYARWYRFLIFWPGSDSLLRTFVRDPDWPHPERSVSALNDETRLGLTAYIESQVGDDPALLAKVLPKYPPFVKRFLQDDGGWLGALKRDNVTLDTSGVVRVGRDRIHTEDGSEYPVDVIVFATGFHASRFLWPMEIVGRGGVVLEKEWGEDPKAYLGITVPRFPNLFCLYGPGTNLAHAGSIIFHSECQVRYLLGCIKVLLEGGHAALDCKPEVNEAFNERLDEALSKLVLSHPGETSWYKNSKGRVTATSPWRLVDYWAWTREPDLDDYEWIEGD
jgi:4-hydroxyacetophenone monooxygenase